MARARLVSAFVMSWFIVSAMVPAGAFDLQQNSNSGQIRPGPTSTPGRPTRPPGAGRPTATPPVTRPTSRPPQNRPPQNRPPARPTARPTANPWRPNRPPNVRPPNVGWQRPPWANRPRPPWAHSRWRPNYVLVNPRFGGNRWWWNHGAPWYVNNGYWGGGFWGSFGPFTLAIGTSIWNQTRFVEPGWGSPGWWLFQNYGLTPARCGPQNLVYIYGPNDSVMCAHPNEYVLAGFYYVDPGTLQLYVM
jgi:hypothetical protein